MLTVKGLTKQYKDLTAVDHLDFDIQKGEVLGLLGHNGAGKSTTIKMILGIIDGDGGEVLWEGKDIRKQKVSVGYLPEERGLFEKTKVYDQLVYFGKLEGMNKKDIDEAIDYWLNRSSIPEYKKKKVKELSKGNRQKIQLIVALLHNPDLVILDEPFSGLDPMNTNVFADIIQEEIDKGKTIILSSHRMEKLDAFCKKIVILKKGKAILSGDLDEIKKERGIEYVLVKCDRDAYDWIEKKGYPVERSGEHTKVLLHDDARILELFTHLKEEGFVVREFVVKEPVLNDIFISEVSKA